MKKIALIAGLIFGAILSASSANESAEIIWPTAETEPAVLAELADTTRPVKVKRFTFAGLLSPPVSRFSFEPLPFELPTPNYAPLATSIRPAEAYTIILMGDSMTEYLGENTDELRKSLANYYPNKVFGIFNYGEGATNILSAQEKLENESSFNGKTFPAILKREFDLILIESFGHNPLAQFPLEEGLQKQTEALDRLVESIRATHPNSIIAFVATIAPNRERYAEGTVELSPEQRYAWAQERAAYIENHIDYARNHDIPLINVYQKSLDGAGNGELKYINQADFIHPSAEGVRLISQEIANFIYQTQVLPL